MIMVPRGESGHYMNVDPSGYLTAILKGMELGVGLHTISVDDEGQMIMVPRGESGHYMDVDVNGFLSAILKGYDGAAYQTIKTDEAGRMEALMKGAYDAALKTIAVDEDGRMEAMLKGTKDITRGLRLWYKFNPREGVYIKDSTDWGNDAIAYVDIDPVATYTDGEIGQAIELHGGDECLIVPYHSSIGFTSECTLELWVYTETLPLPVGPNHEILYRAGTNMRLVLLQDTSNLLFLTTMASGNVNLSYTLPAEKTWYHIVITIADGTQILYVNNVVEDTDIQTGAITLAEVDLIIGNDEINGSEGFEGRLDEFRMYSWVLTAGDVAVRYNLTKAATIESLQEIKVGQLKRFDVGVSMLPYQNQVLESYSHIQVGLGDTTLESDAVPIGKLWMLTNINGYCSNQIVSGITVKIKVGMTSYTLERIVPTVAYEVAKVRGEIVLTVGDKIAVTFSGVPDTGAIIFNLNGYELSIPK